MKDNFSSNSEAYARFRPGYPDELFDYLYSIVPGRQNAWDCGTGNGQVARELAKRFQVVCATDISQSQLDNAVRCPNITYSRQPAEKTDFKADSFDLITVAQAVHWFDFDKFYREVKRTAAAGAWLAVMGYGRIRISAEIDPVITRFYEKVVGPFWDPERRYIDDHYKTIPFPFSEIVTPEFTISGNWQVEHLLGYLNTWSAVKHFIRENGYNPVNRLEEEVRALWGENAMRAVEFPVLLRLGGI